jgi:aspartyl aminopeptidase
VFSARLDNLMMSYTVLTALINSTKDSSESLCNDPNIRLISLFDNEEIGSETAQGANSLLLESTLRRLCASKVGAAQNTAISESVFEETIHKSFMISADMAHAVHPNYWYD